MCLWNKIQTCCQIQFSQFFFAFSPELGYNSYVFCLFFYPSEFGRLYRAFSELSYSGEVSFFCSVTFQSLCSPLITPISSVKRTFAARQRDRKAKSKMRPDIFSRIAYQRLKSRHIMNISCQWSESHYDCAQARRSFYIQDRETCK